MKRPMLQLFEQIAPLKFVGARLGPLSVSNDHFAQMALAPLAHQ